MTLDARQTELVMSLAKEVSEDIETKPFDVAADRIEGLAIVLDLIGLTEAAELAWHICTALRSCKETQQELAKKLSEMLANAKAQPATPEGK